MKKNNEVSFNVTHEDLAAMDEGPSANPINVLPGMNHGISMIQNQMSAYRMTEIETTRSGNSLIGARHSRP